MTTSKQCYENGDAGSSVIVKPLTLDDSDIEKPFTSDDPGEVLRSIPGTNITSMFWMMRDVRILVAGHHWIKFQLRDDDTVRKIFHNSQVFVSMSELDAEMSGCIAGNAPMTVMNVVPQFRTIFVRYHLDWPNALHVRFNIMIVN